MSKYAFLLITLIFSIKTATANLQNCRHLFFENTPPILPEKMQIRTYNICSETFATKYSGITKTGIYSAELLTFRMLGEAKKIKRINEFHEESSIPLLDRASLLDYRFSGYDRGHLAPNADRINVNDQYNSFSLTNIIPQAPKNNQGRWADIEKTVRYLVIKNKKPTFVITGGLYLKKNISTIGKNQIFIPTHIYKVVYIPDLNYSIAYFSPNNDSNVVETISVSELEKISGIKFFPTAK